MDISFYRRKLTVSGIERMAVSTVREAVAGKIAGEIILSTEPGVTMRKWRELFGISQMKLAEKMGVSPSVVSDYESGRRKSPGTRFVKRFVEAIVTIDEEEGGRLLREFSRLGGISTGAILDIREFPFPVTAKKLCNAVEGEVLTCAHLLDRNVYGYTVLDSIKAIVTLPDFTPIFGTTTERALVFVNVTYGRSPMVAVRVAPLKPRMVVLHRPEKADELAVKLAEIEQIPLVISKMPDSDALIKALKALQQSVVDRKPAV